MSKIELKNFGLREGSELGLVLSVIYPIIFSVFCLIRQFF